MTVLYNEESIRVLDGVNAIRKVPGMYIGHTDNEGVHHLFEEILSNSIDEYLAGYGNEINICLRDDGSLTIQDYGRGIPCKTHKELGISTLEVILTKLHSGSKFSCDVYKMSGGLHGVGLAVVNALSEFLKAEIHRDNKVYKQKYKRGIPETDVVITSEKKQKITGTKITFLPDNKIFSDISFNEEKIKSRLRELSYLNKNLILFFKKEEKKRKGKEKKEKYQSKEGIIAFINDIDNKPLYPPIILTGKKTDKNGDNIIYEVAFTHSNKLSYGNNYIVSFVNNIHTVHGGYHESTAKNGVFRFISSLSKSLSKKIKQNDVENRLIMVVNIFHSNPNFFGQTKEKFSNRIYLPIFQDLQEYFSLSNKKSVKNTLKNIILDNLKKRKEVEDKIIPKLATTNKKFIGIGKLISATSTDPKKREVFLVEGDSAGGSAKLNRDKETQAILPLKGKILNVQNVRLSKILANKEISDMISVIGTGIGSNFDYSRLNYGKIIILTDADSDGAHITTLLLVFFNKYMKELVKKGHIYIATPPLFRITLGKRKQFYVRDEKELEKIKKNYPDKNLKISRFKGLGEMNPEDLYETTMNPKNRTLIQMTLPNPKEADKIAEIIMGSNVKERIRLLELDVSCPYSKKTRSLI